MSTDPRSRRARVVVAVEDEDVRRRLARALAGSELDIRVVEPGGDPLRAEGTAGADLLVVRRSRMRPEDLRVVDRYTHRETTPGVVVFHEDDDAAARAGVLAAGAAGIVAASDSDSDIRATVEALAGAELEGGLAGPHAGGAEPEARLADFRSRSSAMRDFLDLVGRVVETDSSLLITGETGVGKERLARAIHNEGARRTGPFVSVNCGAIPEQLLESELFGHEAGAFTGASKRKRGRFEQADGGTIFLDEIGDMPIHLQVKLLTVLQRRRVQRVGSEERVPTNVRVMAATNRELGEAVRSGDFRQDLYYRLNVVCLRIPPLRERAVDIPDLVGSMIHHFRGLLGRRDVEGISEAAIDAMERWAWPGNVRELVNAVEHAVVMCRTKRIEREDLPVAIARGEPDAVTAPVQLPVGASARALVTDEDLGRPLREAKRDATARFEREYLEALLERTRGRVGEVASLAGIAPRSLYDKLKAHDLRKEDYTR